MWKFDEIPQSGTACTLIAPDGAEVPAFFHGVSVSKGVLLCSFEGVAEGDGGRGKKGYMEIPLADVHPSDSMILRDRIIAACG